MKNKKMKECVICHKQIDEDLYYCPHCGEWNSCCGLTLKDIFSDELAQKENNVSAHNTVPEHNYRINTTGEKYDT